MEESKKIAEYDRVSLEHVTNGKEYYSAGIGARKRSGVYEIGAEYWYEREIYKRYLAPETIRLFEEARERFYRAVKEAIGGRNGYKVVAGAGGCVAYRRLPGSGKGFLSVLASALMGPRYSFVLSCENYTRIFDGISVYEFFGRFILPSDAPQEEKRRLEKMHELFMDSETNGGDRYLACAFKECCGKMTREDADLLCADDGTYRFIPEDKVYDTDDIEVLEVKNGEYTFSGRTVNFVLEVDIDGKEYVACWRPNDVKYAVRCYPPFRVDCAADPNKITIRSKMFNRAIAVSDAIKNIIDAAAERVFRAAYMSPGKK